MVDALKGFPDAIEAVFPQATVQTCLVHLIRRSLAYVSYKERRALAGALKTIYRAPTEAAAHDALEALEAGAWPRFRREAAASAIRACAYLSLQALLDRSARKGHPITRQIRSVSVSPETGKPLRAPRGGFVRGGPLVPNPAARFAPFLPERHLAAFVGRASSRKALRDARAAVLAFSRGPDPVVELVPERGGWRVYAARTAATQFDLQGTPPGDACAPSGDVCAPSGHANARKSLSLREFPNRPDSP